MFAADNKTSKGTLPTTSRPKEIASGVYCLEVGKGITRSNVYFVRSGSSWVLIDTGSARCDREIQAAAISLFGVNRPSSAILLTHDHPDHAGSASELARRWGCLVYVHPDELALATTDFSHFFSIVKGYASPLDTWVILPLMRLMPTRHEALLSKSSFKDVVRAFDPGAGVPGLPDWECIHSPGHSPGHVSFFREVDRVLITGDAILTVHLNSVWSFLRWGLGRNKQRLSGPPWSTTWNWRAAKMSVATLAQLDPLVLACGHGLPMSGPGTASALRAFADHLRSLSRPERGNWSRLASS